MVDKQKRIGKMLKAKAIGDDAKNNPMFGSRKFDGSARTEERRPGTLTIRHQEHHTRVN